MTNYKVKSGLISFVQVISLSLLYVGFTDLGIIHKSPELLEFMLATTCAFAILGAILRAFNLSKAIQVFGIVTFVFLCIGLFYSTAWYEFVSFAVCLAITLSILVQPCIASGKEIANSDKSIVNA